MRRASSGVFGSIGLSSLHTEEIKVKNLNFLQMRKTPTTQAERRNPLIYIPNIIGYVRLGLAFISVWLNIKWFSIFFSISYLLDALDGYTARSLNQESDLGYILDLGTDKASGGMLMLYVCKTYPWLSGPIGSCLMLDIISHMFCVAVRFKSNVSHKSHTGDGIVSRILRIHYKKPVLFMTCFGEEGFLLAILCFPNKYILLCPLGAIFAFKQIVNILQFWNAMKSILKETPRQEEKKREKEVS